MTTELRPYNDKTSLIIDLKLWLAWKNGAALDLSMLPRITTTRWPWMVENWDRQFYDLFLNFADGDEYLLNVLEKLDNHVFAWREGARVNPFSSLELFAEAQEFLALIPFTSITPTSSENRVRDFEVQRVANFEADHFQEMRRFLKENRDTAFDFLGLGDPDYNRFRGRSSSPFQRNFFASDLYNTDQAIEVEKFIEGILLEFKYQQDTEPNLLEFANRNLAAGGSEVRAEDIWESFFEVPFEQSLEQMSKVYLGTESRWFELVTVNKLKAPYVDLYGQKLNLVENASGNTVRVTSAESAKYRINNTVKIGSRIVPEEVRRVEEVIDNQDGTSSVVLSGEQDLSKLRLEHLPFMRVYQADTLRDFSFVKIPVTLGAPYQNLPEPTIGKLKELERSLYAFGVDLERDDRTGDLVYSSTGDFSIVYGIKAVRQAVVNVIRTELGEIPLHPNYGLPPTIGFAMEGGDTAAQVGTIIESAIARDPRFTSVSISDIVISAEGEINVAVLVKIAGSSQLIPLAFVV